MVRTGSIGVHNQLGGQMHNHSVRAPRTIGITFLVSLVTLTLVADSARRGPVPENIEDLQEAVQRILDKDDVPGAGIALVSKEGIIWNGGGRRR